jgi:hypothetical protein
MPPIDTAIDARPPPPPPPPFALPLRPRPQTHIAIAYRALCFSTTCASDQPTVAIFSGRPTRVPNLADPNHPPPPSSRRHPPSPAVTRRHPQTPADTRRHPSASSGCLSRGSRPADPTYRRSKARPKGAQPDEDLQPQSLKVGLRQVVEPAEGGEGKRQKGVLEMRGVARPRRNRNDESALVVVIVVDVVVLVVVVVVVVAHK